MATLVKQREIFRYKMSRRQWFLNSSAAERMRKVDPWRGLPRPPRRTMAGVATPDVCHASDHPFTDGQAWWAQLEPTAFKERRIEAAFQPWKRPKVVGIGLYKTGVTSLLASLRKLGYHSCCNGIYGPLKFNVDFHNSLPLMKPWDTNYAAPDRWAEAENLFHLHEWVAHHEAFSDFPWMYAFPWVDAAFPTTKFVLTVRGCVSTLSSAGTMWVRGWKPEKTRLDHERIAIRAGEGSPNSREEHAQWVRAVACGRTLLPQYERHMRRVIAYFAGRPDSLRRLLVLDVRQPAPWVRLCTFLEVPPHLCAKAAGGDPNVVDFTHANDAAKWDGPRVECADQKRRAFRSGRPSASNTTNATTTAVSSAGQPPRHPPSNNFWPTGSLCEQLVPYLCAPHERQEMIRRQGQWTNLSAAEKRRRAKSSLKGFGVR